ncbi:MAG TPA: hypothetical protein VGN17_26025 [Bryobacteraceae bacterium]|jgi:hypothetical protein
MSALDIALQAHCSTTLVRKKLKASKTPQQIIDEGQAWLAGEEARRKKRESNPALEGEALESFHAAQTRKERALADLRELEHRTKLGQLADVNEINLWVSGMLIRFRDILLRIPTELSERLAAETDQGNVRRLLDDEIRRALAELQEFHV